MRVRKNKINYLRAFITNQDERQALAIATGKAMRAKRAVNDLSQREVARAVGLSQQMYSSIERGERRPGSTGIAQRIADALQIPRDVLFPEFAVSEEGRRQTVHMEEQPQ